MSERRSRTFWLAFIAVVALVTWGRIWLIDHLHDQGWFTKYVEFADLILAGRPPRARIGDVSAAYLWLMVAMRALRFGVHAIRDAQLVAVSAVAVLAAVVAKRYAGWTAAIAAALIVLANRSALVIATELEPESLILLLNAAALAALVAARRPRGFAAAGLLLGLSCIARPVALATLVLVAAWLFYATRKAVLPFVLAALVPIVAIVLINRGLTGDAIIMQPGTVFYEGNNPLATGAAGTMPQVVDDMNGAAPEADYLHVAYRIVAARATGQPLAARLSNRYWSGKARAWIRTYPAAALRLTLRKLVFAVHHYEIHDLLTTKRKAMELARYPAIPFGIPLVLALVAFLLRRDRRELLLVALFAAATFFVLVAFYVTARQRNAMLPAMAVLGGIGVAETIALLRTRLEQGLLVLGALLVASPLLGIDTGAIREDRYLWVSTFTRSSLVDAARRANARGDRLKATQLAAEAAVYATEEPPIVTPITLRSVALVIAQSSDQPERRFDAAIALEKAGAWRDAELVLRTLDRYRPHREARAVSSVWFYRARAALHLGAPPAVVFARLEQAMEEAPGDPHLLALRGIAFNDREALRMLDALHDPFIRDRAMAFALDDVGRHADAVALRAKVARAIPEWPRAARVTKARK